MEKAIDGVVELVDWGVIQAKGPDAAKFLHGQLTQDFMLVRPDQARLAAYCSPKGRMMAGFIGIKRGPEDIVLLCRSDILAPVLKRLTMFVLRAKLQLRDASADFRLAGLLGTSATALLGASPPAWHLATGGTASTVALPPAEHGLVRGLWLANHDAPLPEGPRLDIATWRWAEVSSALAWVGPATMESFVPQMLNYESLGGVNFKKGCYPGQEVVARSQFRGTLKRRAHVLRGECAMSEGAEVFHSADPDQPCGTVAMAATSPAGGFVAVASLQLSALTSGSLHLGSAQGPVLTLLPLPYPLLEDV